jgi:alpha-L-rhamnosidase
VYDATKDAALLGWSTAGYDDVQWEQAEVVSLEGTTYTDQNLGYDNFSLIGQIGNNAGGYTTLVAKSVKEVRKGVFVYDMGQNFVGVPRIRFTEGKAGNKITLRVAEMLYPDLPESGDNVGMVMLENYRAALSQDQYIMKDGTQVFQPKFTSHGYQYIEITGIDAPLPLDAVEGLAISSVLKLTADYQTSNPKVNKLWSNLVWSNIDNFLSIPTDCPQRNERMGWSGDINVFSRTATYISNADQFLRRHLMAMRDVCRHPTPCADRRIGPASARSLCPSRPSPARLALRSPASSMRRPTSDASSWAVTSTSTTRRATVAGTTRQAIG